MSRLAMIAFGATCLTAVAGCNQSAPNVPQSEGAAGPHVLAATDIEAGRYIVATSGCNDCHTPMYARTNGAQPPESEWLKGSPEPHKGPWGTSYGKNLRLTVASLTEDEWVELLSSGSSLPPMPWPSVRNMSEPDKRALYRYIKSLPGDPGQPAPASMPAGPSSKAG